MAKFSQIITELFQPFAKISSKISSNWNQMPRPGNVETKPVDNVYLPEGVDLIEVIDPFKNEALLHKFRVMKNQADGNCLFMAISQALWGNQNYFNIVRKQVVNYILSPEHWTEYFPHIKCQHEALADESEDIPDSEWEEIYRNYMSSDRTYGTLQELVAASQLYTFNPIIIRILNEDLFNFQLLHESEYTRTNFFLFTGSADEGHFEWLQPLIHLRNLKIYKGNYRTFSMEMEQGVIKIAKTLDSLSGSLCNIYNAGTDSIVSNTNDANNNYLNANMVSGTKALKFHSLVDLRDQGIPSPLFDKQFLKMDNTEPNLNPINNKFEPTKCLDNKMIKRRKPRDTKIHSSMQLQQRCTKNINNSISSLCNHSTKKKISNNSVPSFDGEKMQKQHKSQTIKVKHSMDQILSSDEHRKLDSTKAIQGKKKSRKNKKHLPLNKRKRRQAKRGSKEYLLISCLSDSSTSSNDNNETGNKSIGLNQKEISICRMLAEKCLNFFLCCFRGPEDE